MEKMWKHIVLVQAKVALHEEPPVEVYMKKYSKQLLATLGITSATLVSECSVDECREKNAIFFLAI
jgi:FMN-dependent NADH-azoreductase